MAIKLIGNISELGAGTRGASLCVEALKIASFNKNSEYFSEYPISVIKNENELLFSNIIFHSAKRIKGIVNVFNEIAKKVDQTLNDGDFPIIIAGDHSSAGGTIAGIKKRYPNKRLGAIWIDAHADLHTPYTSPSGNVHGMPLGSALGFDNIECAVKEVKPEVKAMWEQLKSCGGVSPKILPKDIVFYGVRDTEGPEDKIIEREGIKNFTVAETRQKGIAQVCKEGLAILNDCDLIYISFDVDSMDCDLVSMGTGTPVPNGYSPEEANGIIQELIKSDKLVCFELVEVNPTLDNKQNLMAETAFEILENTTKSIKNKGV